MAFKTSCVLICIFSVNSSSKNVIQISIDDFKQHGRDGSNERNHDKNIEIEISKNQSHHYNFIPTSSFSDSIETYDRTEFKKRVPRVLLKQKKRPEIIGKAKNTFGSNKETKSSRRGIQNDERNMQIEPDSKIERMPAVFAKLSVKNSNEIIRKPVRRKSHNSQSVIKETELTKGIKLYNNIPGILNDEKILNVNENIKLTRKIQQDEAYHIPCSLVNNRKQAVLWPACDEPASPLIAQSNYTNEPRNHDYQENTADEENEDDDEQDSLVDYPYSVSVQRKGAHYASGALVGERWVLSTAAEFYNVRETIKLFRLRLGSVDCKKGGFLTPILTITIHTNFTLGKPSFDISVLRTAAPVPQSVVIKPIGLSRVAGKVVSAKFLTTYWPRIVVKQGVVPPSAKERIKYKSMRVSTQKLVATDECSKQLTAANVTLDKNSICLSPVKIYHSDCMPDVGAPVVAVDGLWGITSGWVSPSCPSIILPTIFTRVSTMALLNWINEQMLL